jgi:hypothetical protein
MVCPMNVFTEDKELVYMTEHRLIKYDDTLTYTNKQSLTALYNLTFVIRD